jgi:hypothetical protein
MIHTDDFEVLRGQRKARMVSYKSMQDHYRSTERLVLALGRLRDAVEKHLAKRRNTTLRRAMRTPQKAERYKMRAA